MTALDGVSAEAMVRQIDREVDRLADRTVVYCGAGASYALSEGERLGVMVALLAVRQYLTGDGLDDPEGSLPLRFMPSIAGTIAHHHGVPLPVDVDPGTEGA